MGEKVLKRLRDYSNLAADVVEADALADVPPRLLHHRVPVHVRQEAEAEPAREGGGWVKRLERGCVIRF